MTVVLSAGQFGGDENPDAGEKEGGKGKKSVLLWLPAAANKSFQSFSVFFWKLTLLGDFQCSLEHTQQMQLEHYYWWRNFKYFLPPQMIVLISNTSIYKHRVLVRSFQDLTQISNDFSVNWEESKSQCLLPIFFFLRNNTIYIGKQGRYQYRQGMCSWRSVSWSSSIILKIQLKLSKWKIKCFQTKKAAMGVLEKKNLKAQNPEGK